METIGELLKKKREEKGLGFDEIKEETGIITEHLEALEKNDFLHFPNKVYARSFLRDYANYLCMDSFKLLEIFETEYAKLKDDIEEYSEPLVGEPVKLPTEGAFLNKTIGIFVVFLLLCAGAYLVGKNTNTNNLDNKNIPVQTEKATDNTIVPVNEKPAPVANVSKPAKQPDKVAEAIKEADKKAEAIAKESDTVTVYAHKNLWVKIEVDGKPAYEGTIKQGANLEFKVKSTIKLRGGEPSACQININGKSIGSLGNPGKPFDLVINPKNNSVVKQ